MTPELLSWYRQAKRDLPWRDTRDPYRIWISEVMLQQTQVATVIPYYDRWLQRFPDVTSLAKAGEQEALSAWQGLGYYRRCRNLLRTARIICEGGWPTSAKGWKKLPGIGDYTAAAIASICLDEPCAVVDGNVERVFARVCASDLVGTSRRSAAQRWAQGILDPAHPAEFNQALMELGATVCRPVKANCDNCPIRPWCRSCHAGTQLDFPRRASRPETKDLTMELAIYLREGNVGLCTASEGAWWAGMRVFPHVSSHDGMERIGEFRHTVTHHRITVRVHVCVRADEPPGLDWVSIEAMAAEPLPAAMQKAWKLAKDHLTERASLRSCSFPSDPS